MSDEDVYKSREFNNWLKANETYIAYLAELGDQELRAVLAGRSAAKMRKEFAPACTEQRADAVRKWHASGVSIARIAKVLGVLHQRVSQIVRGVG